MKSSVKVTTLTALLLMSVAAQAKTPLLDVKPVQLIAEKGCMEEPDSHCYALQVVTLKTGQAWLDNYFEQKSRDYLTPAGVMDGDEKELKEQHDELTKLDLDSLAKAQLDSVKKVLTGEDAIIGWEIYYAPHFLGQRGNIAMFSENFYTFFGGAHGYGSTMLTNFNLDTQEKLTIDSLVEPGQREALVNMLKVAYVDYIKLENQSVDGASNLDLIAQERLNDYKDTFASNDFNFTFTYAGLEFKFPPYALGSYAEGEINLLLPYQSLFGVVKRDFLADSVKSINFSEGF